jgi:hypothetical protein
MQTTTNLNISALEIDLAQAQEALSQHLAAIALLQSQIETIKTNLDKARTAQKANLESIKLFQFGNKQKRQGVLIVSTWEEANNIVKKWVKNSPKSKNTDCRLIFDFSDGQRFEMDFSLDPINKDQINLAYELSQKLKKLAGDRPNWKTEEQHKKDLKYDKIDANVMARHKHLLGSWNIPV